MDVSKFQGVGVSCSLRNGGVEVGENREAEVPGGSEVEEAKEGPYGERSTCWAWNLPETSL